MAVRLKESDYHEINACYETLRKGAAAFYGVDFVALVSAVTLVIASRGWPGPARIAGFWTLLPCLFIFIGFATVVLVPFINWFLGGAHLARADVIEVRAAARRLAFFMLMLSAAATAPVICGFLLFFFTGSKLAAVLIGACGTVAKIPVFPKRHVLEDIVRAARESAGLDKEEEPEQSGRYEGFPGLPRTGDGEVEVPAHVRKRLLESRDQLESLMESGRQKNIAKESGEHQPPKQKDS